MTKINIATHLNQVFTNSVRATLAANPAMVDSRRYLGPARDAVTLEAARLLRILKGLGNVALRSMPPCAQRRAPRSARIALWRPSGAVHGLCKCSIGTSASSGT